MIYRYEIHSHTAEVSLCGHVTAAESVRMYLDAGYNGMVVTDHYHEEYFSSLGDIPWKDKVSRFLQGYRAAEEAARGLDFTVLVGAEIRFNNSANDYLVFGIDEGFLLDFPNLQRSSLSYFRKAAKCHGRMMIIQAHPFRRGATRLPSDLSMIDGLEVFNGNPRHDSRNHLAETLAAERNLIGISGSDFHQVEDLASGGILSPSPINTSQELLIRLRSLQSQDLIMQEAVCP